MTEPDHSIADNLLRVRGRIADAAGRAGRLAGDIRLVAVTKRVEAGRVIEAVRAGATDIGENYVQEARAKIPLVNAACVPNSEPAWHLIGHLQSNKAKYAVGLFSLIQSVDSFALAREIDRQAAKLGRIQPVLIEVNLARSIGRPGLAVEAALDTAARIVDELSHVALRGLMGMAPTPVGGDAAEAARPYFRELHDLWERLPSENRRDLSMGMSGDFEVAIEEGATLVRIGTALFGSRKAKG